FTSFLATGDFDATIKGVDDLQREYEEQFGFTDEAGNPISYQPNLAVTYWSFRLMIGLAVFSAVLALAALWLTRKGRMTDNVWFARLGVLAIPMPFLASSFGWIFTEMGRQPWVVVPNPNPSGVDGVWLLTAQGVSEVTSVGHVAGSLVAFTALYGVLAVIWYRLMHRYAVEGIAETPDSPTPDQDADAPLSFAYSGAHRGPCDRLVPAHRRPVDGLPRARGLRLRGRDAARHLRPPPQGRRTRRHRREEPPRHHQHDRPRVGRQRGVAAHRRRSDLRGLPRVVRDLVLGLLHPAADHPARAHRARRGLRVAREDRVRDVARVGRPRARGRLVGPRGAVGRRVREPRAGRRARREPPVRGRVLRPAQPLRPARWRGHGPAVPH